MNTTIKKIGHPFKDQNVLVIGDFILDVHLNSTPIGRIPKGNMPEVDFPIRHLCLGGSAQLASYLQHNGAQVCYMTVLGEDQASQTAIQLLKEKGIPSICIHFTAASPTLIHTRLDQEEQQAYPGDIIPKLHIDNSVMDSFLKDIEKAYFNCDILYISDYEKGTISKQVLRLLRQLQEKSRKTIVVDATNYDKYKHLSPVLIKTSDPLGFEWLGKKQLQPYVPLSS
ncbi:PfkB family carbohydrate kinase [Sphingobacterium sp. SRCM116780]|uniref:PfkB family carbohydrate kinase n=1 Tax=Sphingobacterium sp. SRCM116780 TaxID=2907623 RepID=UPI001F26B387|nr:PfkB family carbohydrate kinase [Sphingobacterium sp. SRCM116780]UIR57367.1 PfkB family carbohydrate kinase [Sphingobacterium sp. SRCM116780]